jgi:hypothetical protein
MTARVVVGELTLDRAKLALSGHEAADIVYSDPPWGPGNLRYWRTHNEEATPDWEGERRWNTFLATFCDVVKACVRPGGHVFVEMGTRWVDQLASEMGKREFAEAGRWTCYYGTPKLPNVLWYSGPGKVSLTADSGVAMTMSAISCVAKPGLVVMDPCCGKGMTARCATRLGMHFVGVELNPKRAAKTIDWCKRHDPPRP